MTDVFGAARANADVHEELDRRLRAHRVRVMDRDGAEALRTWDAFARLLERHIADEEALVLPAYAELCRVDPPARGGAPEIVDRDHDKLRSHLHEIGSRLQALVGAAGAEPFLALLDRQKILVDLLEHHDLRETQLVYPHLLERIDSQCAERIRARLADSLTVSEEGADR